MVSTVGVGKEQPITRDIAPPGANEVAKGQVKGKDEIRDLTWADIVKMPPRETKQNILRGREGKKG